jgi:hypothetical protein
VKEWMTVIALLGTDFLPLSQDLDFSPSVVTVGLWVCVYRITTRLLFTIMPGLILAARLG